MNSKAEKCGAEKWRFGIMQAASGYGHFSAPYFSAFLMDAAKLESLYIAAPFPQPSGV